MNADARASGATSPASAAFGRAMRYGAPLARVLFALVTMRTDDPCWLEDGGDPAYGFPFPWIRLGGSSGSFAIDARALALDLASYLGAGAALCAWGPVRRLGARRRRLLTAALWMPAALVLAVYGVILAVDPFLMPISFGQAFTCARPPERSLHVGFYPP